MRILVVEDNAFIADDVKFMLEEMGIEVIGPAHNVNAALEILASTAVDGAVLDVNLGAETAFPIADALMERKKPFVFASSVYREQIPERFNGYDLVPKPAEIRKIMLGLFGQPR